MDFKDVLKNISGRRYKPFLILSSINIIFYALIKHETCEDT